MQEPVLREWPVFVHMATNVCYARQGLLADSALQQGGGRVDGSLPRTRLPWQEAERCRAANPWWDLHGPIYLSGSESPACAGPQAVRGAAVDARTTSSVGNSVSCGGADAAFSIF